MCSTSSMDATRHDTREQPWVTVTAWAIAGTLMQAVVSKILTRYTITGRQCHVCGQARRYCSESLFKVRNRTMIAMNNLMPPSSVSSGAHVGPGVGCCGKVLSSRNAPPSATADSNLK